MCITQFILHFKMCYFPTFHKKLRIKFNKNHSKILTHNYNTQSKCILLAHPQSCQNHLLYPISQTLDTMIFAGHSLSKQDCDQTSYRTDINVFFPNYNKL